MNGGVISVRSFDFHRGNGLSTGNDHILASINNGYPALIVHYANVAGKAPCEPFWIILPGAPGLLGGARVGVIVECCIDRKSGVEGKSVSVRVALGGRLNIKQNIIRTQN